MNIQTFTKQYEAFQLLLDKTTTEILYGGSVYSGKSYLACIYAIYMCLTYTGIRGAIGRARLTNLTKSTFQTFLSLVDEMGIRESINYNSQSHIITFSNGSQIFLLDLFPLPADPNFTRLGGHEYTFVIIDEAAEVPMKAYQVLKTRIRYKLQENDLIGKMLICSNPSKGWLYDTFYSPWRTGELPTYRKFIQALPQDNTFADPKVLETYTIENLGILFYNLLVLGDWDYDSSALDLFDFDSLNNSFYIIAQRGRKILTCDPAGQGNDKCIITIWDNYQCIDIQEYAKTTIPQITELIKSNMLKYGIPISNVVVDAGGLGLGVSDMLMGSKKFIANLKPLKNEIIYGTLKDQLFFKFGELIKNGKIGIEADTIKQGEIVRELQAHKMYNPDKGKTQITPKALVKQMIGKSPDMADALVMRAYFEYVGTNEMIIGW